MNKLLTIGGLLLCFLGTGCTAHRQAALQRQAQAEENAQAARTLAAAQRKAAVASDSVETIAFHTSVSSVTVENMAKRVGCTGGQGAGLITPKGPVEVYRMACDNGKVFLVRCELRQCTPL
jgi:hypothetical protein